MGKDNTTSNPAERYHKEQRKKALKKNKIQRIKQRDERVAATETSSTIRSEIDALERKREKRQGYLDTADIRKLERLQKELKIVLKAEEDRQKLQKEDDERLSSEQQQQHSYYGDDPTTSYYYHPTLNPYGAPPPGRPMMWHCKFGGTTMDIRMAGFPCDPKQPSELGSTIPPPTVATKLECRTVPQQPPPTAPPLPPPSIPHPRESNKVIPPPPPPLPKGKPPQQPTHSKDAPQPRVKDSISDTPSIPEPVKPRLNGLPQLPEPSLAVRRGKKSRSLQADIWATTDELVYEGQQQLTTTTTTEEEEPIRRTNQETTHQQQKRKRSNKDYDINDPCCPAGENYSDYRGDVVPNNSNKLVNRWYYKDSTSGTVQGPFTSEQMIQWKDAGFFPLHTPMRNGETGTFRALSCMDLTAPLSSQNDLLELSNGPEGVEARLAALRGEMTTVQPQEEMNTFATVDNDIQKEEIHAEEEQTLLQKASPNNDGEEEESAYYYPVDTNELLQQEEVNDAEYPTDLSYPVDLSYPIYEEDSASYVAANREIPVYPVHHLIIAPENLNTTSEPIKKKVVPYKGDKDVVAFMPSHLQVKRQREDSGSIKKTKAANSNMTSYVHSLPQKATTQPVATSVTDDYNNFIEEINRLT